MLAGVAANKNRNLCMTFYARSFYAWSFYCSYAYNLALDKFRRVLFACCIKLPALKRFLRSISTVLFPISLEHIQTIDKQSGCLFMYNLIDAFGT